MKRYLMTIEYDGKCFCGWQLQPNVRTVQGELEVALSKLYGSPVRLHGSGRTDSGVHAIGQTAHFEVDPGFDKRSIDQIRNGVNSFSAEDVYIHSVEPVEDDFHARFSAKSREYCYEVIDHPYPLLNQRAWHVKGKLSSEDAKTAAEMIIGRHSFRGFCLSRPGEDDYICEVTRSDWIRTEKGYQFRINANRFFHQMVRGLVRAVVDVARSRMTLEKFTEILHHARSNALVSFAPSCGLTLIKVNYR